MKRLFLCSLVAYFIGTGGTLLEARARPSPPALSSDEAVQILTRHSGGVGDVMRASEGYENIQAIDHGVEAFDTAVCGFHVDNLDKLGFRYSFEIVRRVIDQVEFSGTDARRVMTGRFHTVFGNSNGSVAFADVSKIVVVFGHVELESRIDTWRVCRATASDPAFQCSRIPLPWDGGWQVNLYDTHGTKVLYYYRRAVDKYGQLDKWGKNAEAAKKDAHEVTLAFHALCTNAKVSSFPNPKKRNITF